MAITIIHAKGWKKVFGLIRKEQIKPLFFQTRWGIHTFGVKKPIDVVILDNDQKIVTLKKNLKPNRIFIWNPKYKNILELPKGTIEKEKLQQGKKISLQFI